MSTGPQNAPQSEPQGEGASAAPQPLITPARRKDDSKAWLVTFTDLIALMLTFFVMMFAMSAVKTVEWQNLTESLRERLSTVLERRQAAPSLRLDMPGTEARPGRDLDYLAGLMREQLRQTPALQGGVVRRETDRLFVSLPADILFNSGSFRLTERAASAVFTLGGALRNLTNRLSVAGHADPRQPRRRYPSNWELSLLRAQSVAAALRDSGYDGPILARGYGDAQFSQLPADLTADERNALARRVDIVIEQTARETP